MKTHMQRWLARVALSLVAIAAWGTGATAQSLSGVYGGENCPYMLTFRGKDVVYIQFLVGGKVMQELPGQYKVDGDKIAVTAPSWGAVFTQKGNALETPAMGQTMVCTKLSDVGSARPVPTSNGSINVYGSWRVVGRDGNGNAIYERRSQDPNGNILVQRAMRDRNGKMSNVGVAHGVAADDRPEGSGRVSTGSGPGAAMLAYFDALKRGDTISVARFFQGRLLE